MGDSCRIGVKYKYSNYDFYDCIIFTIGRKYSEHNKRDRNKAISH